MKILIVEDEPKTGEYLRKGLQEAGFTVDLARNGVDVFVAGSAVFGHPPYDEVIKKLKSSRPAVT